MEERTKKKKEKKDQDGGYCLRDKRNRESKEVFASWRRLWNERREGNKTNNKQKQKGVEILIYRYKY